MRERLLYRLVLRVPKATAYGEDLFRAIFGLELDWGKLWRSKSLGAGVNQPEDPWEVRERRLYRQTGFTGSEERHHSEQVSTSQRTRGRGEKRLLVHQPEDPWEVRERLIVYQPKDPWEVRERLFRCFRGVSVTAGGLKRG